MEILIFFLIFLAGVAAVNLWNNANRKRPDNRETSGPVRGLAIDEGLQGDAVAAYQLLRAFTHGRPVSRRTWVDEYGLPERQWRAAHDLLVKSGCVRDNKLAVRGLAQGQALIDVQITALRLRAQEQHPPNFVTPT